MIWLSLAVLALLGLSAARRYQRWREERDRLIRYRNLPRWLIVPPPKDRK
jgi:hypothetical protein